MGMTASSVSPVNATADIRREPTTGGAMLYDASLAGNATEAQFDAAHWRANSTARPVEAGRGEALFIEFEGRRWVLRHYRRGGFFAGLLGDRYFWTGEEGTRPFREWRLLHELRAEGLPVPAAVAARYERVGLLYRGDLITERIEDSRPLSGWLADAPLSAATWSAVGECIRRFHERGVWHADLNAHNILIDSPGQVFLIDFDRGRRRDPGDWAQGNLDRLRRSLDKINAALPAGRFNDDDWRSLLEGYSRRANAAR
jgi:3-deoxy-D-manno-octulosonic acid kinase